MRPVSRLGIRTSAFRSWTKNWPVWARPACYSARLLLGAEVRALLRPIQACSPAQLFQSPGRPLRGGVMPLLSRVATESMIALAPLALPVSGYPTPAQFARAGLCQGDDPRGDRQAPRRPAPHRGRREPHQRDDPRTPTTAHILGGACMGASERRQERQDRGAVLIAQTVPALPGILGLDVMRLDGGHRIQSTTVVQEPGAGPEAPEGRGAEFVRRRRADGDRVPRADVV